MRWGRGEGADNRHIISMWRCAQCIWIYLFVSFSFPCRWNSTNQIFKLSVKLGRSNTRKFYVFQAENQRHQEEIDQLSNRGIAEMQRRHASFVQEPRDIQQQQQEQARGWFDGLLPIFSRGPGDPLAFPNPEGTMGNYDRPQMGGDRREQFPRAEEEDWQCPTCRRVFPDLTLFRYMLWNAMESRLIPPVATT